MSKYIELINGKDGIIKFGPKEKAERLGSGSMGKDSELTIKNVIDYSNLYSCSIEKAIEHFANDSGYYISDFFKELLKHA